MLIMDPLEQSKEHQLRYQVIVILDKQSLYIEDRLIKVVRSTPLGVNKFGRGKFII